MVSNKRIILVGPSATGKNFMREEFFKKGFTVDCSYTTRKIRKNEVHDVDYHFISKEEFDKMIAADQFYEHVKYNDNYYGTGRHEWDNYTVFIMEADGVNKIMPEDRKNCVVIYINTPFDTRLLRMKERGWRNKKILERTREDLKKFDNFKNYDIEISSEAFT